MENESVFIEDNDFVNNLPPECLFHIFSFLNIEDRLRLTTVCKRWRSFGAEAWRDVTKVDLIPLEKSKTEHSRLLALCGELLKDLTISVPNDTSDIIRVVTTNCPNLIKFRVRFGDRHGHRAEHCQDLAKLFAKTKTKLRNLVLDNIGQEFVNHADCLLELPEELVEFQLWGSIAQLKSNFPTLVRNGTIKPFIPAIKRLEKLEILVLNGLQFLQDDMDVFVSLTNLRYLEISGSVIGSLRIDTIARCRKLEYLSLDRAVNASWINDFVHNNPSLKHLRLRVCFLDMDEIEKLLEFSELETLDLTYRLGFGDCDLSGFRHLRKLIPPFSDSNLLALMETASQLEFIKLSNSDNGLEVLTKAHEVTSRRVNNIPLHIVVRGSIIDKWERPEGISPLLVVESSEDYHTRTHNKYHGYDLEVSH